MSVRLSDRAGLRNAGTPRRIAAVQVMAADTWGAAMLIADSCRSVVHVMEGSARNARV